jgi:DNA-binding NarL/FixJ family response regulator
VTSVEIVDDMPVYAHGLSCLLIRGGFTVIGTRTSSSDNASWGRADVVVMALSLAGDFVVDATFPGHFSRLLLLADGVVTVRATPVGAYAQGCVHRGAEASTFCTAVEAVARGGQYWESAGTAEPVDIEPADERGQLSPREREVLKFIAHGLTHRQIATRLDISSHTVDTYVKRIRVKWSLGNKAELTRAAMLTMGDGPRTSCLISRRNHQ